jgi:hypothetical protein
MVLPDTVLLTGHQMVLERLLIALHVQTPLVKAYGTHEERGGQNAATLNQSHVQVIVESQRLDLHDAAVIS